MLTHQLKNYDSYFENHQCYRPPGKHITGYKLGDNRNSNLLVSDRLYDADRDRVDECYDIVNDQLATK